MRTHRSIQLATVAAMSAATVLGAQSFNAKPTRVTTVVASWLSAPAESYDGRFVATDGDSAIRMFDRATKQWRQVWVDNTASSLDFTAARVDGDMAFVRQFTKDGKTTHQRMVFRDVKPDSLQWLWQSSPDGRAWTTQWDIEYKRMK